MQIKQLSTKKTVLSIIFFCVSLMTLLGLLFSVVSLKVLNKSSSIENGFSYLVFDSIIYTNQLETFKILFGIAAYLMLLLSVVGIVLSVVGFLFFSLRINTNIGLAFCTLFCCVTLAYMIIGIAGASTLNKWLELGRSPNGEVLGISNATEYMRYSTLSFLPFVFAAIFMMAYLLSDALIKENQVGVQCELSANKKIYADVIREKEIAELLKQYKEMLDAGIISSDEFNAKKAQWLNLK